MPTVMDVKNDLQDADLLEWEKTSGELYKAEARVLAQLQIKNVPQEKREDVLIDWLSNAVSLVELQRTSEAWSETVKREFC